MREVTDIVATATELNYVEVSRVLKNISDRLSEIPHQLLIERSKQDDLTLDIQNRERDLIQLDLAASVGIDNAGKLRAEEHLQGDLKKLRGKLTSAKLEIDRIRSEKCHLESLQKDLQTRLNVLEQEASLKKRQILRDQEQAYLEHDVHGKAVKALSDYVVYSALKYGVATSAINVSGLVLQSLNKDNSLTNLAASTFDEIVAKAQVRSYE